jgi:hypothetical protein
MTISLGISRIFLISVMISGFFGLDLWLVVLGLIYAGLAKVCGDFFGWEAGPYFVPLGGTTKG